MTKKLSIKPLFDNVLIKPLEAETKTASGIILPDSAKEKPQIGVVMAVGSNSYKRNNEPGRWLISSEGKYVPFSVEVGQKVMYKKWGGSEVKVDGEEWMMIEQKDILAILS